MKFILKVQEFIKHNIVRFIVSIVFVISFFFIFMILKNEWDVFSHYVDAVFIPGAILFFFGGLACVSYYGQFDMFGFIFNTKRINGKKETLYDYAERRKEKREESKLSYLSYFIVAIITLLIALVLYLIYKNTL